MRSLPRGIYTPLPCFFDDNEHIGKRSVGILDPVGPETHETIELDSFRKHVKCATRESWAYGKLRLMHSSHCVWWDGAGGLRIDGGSGSFG